MTAPTRVATCRVRWCRRPLGTSTYSFGDGLGNVYRKCDGGHWTPEPPPPDLSAIDAADAHDFEGMRASTERYIPPLARELSARVRANLAAHGLSQVDLAGRLDVTQKHVSRVLNGHDDGSLPFWDAMLRESDRG